MKINAAMIVRNEADRIKRCILAAGPFFDRIIVVDTGSVDDTCDIVSSFENTSLYHFDWVDDFSAARNFSLQRSEDEGADYSFVLDADEYLRKPEADIRLFIEQAEKKYAGRWAGYLTRYDSFRNEEGNVDISRTRITRLLPRGVRYSGIIHEQPVFDGIKIYTPFEADHDGYLDTDKGRRDLPYLLKAIREDPSDPYLYYQAGAAYKSEKDKEQAVRYLGSFYQMIAGIPSAFEIDYVRDGVIRYLYALMDLNTEESMTRALSVTEAVKGYYKDNSDYWFFCGVFYMKLALFDTRRYMSYVPMIEGCYKRCIEIGEDKRTMTVRGTGSFKAYHNLGLYYQLTGDEKRARECFKKEKETGIDF